jgi:hypothetical protein
MGLSTTRLKRSLKPQQRLLDGETHFSQVLTDLGCEWMRGIHHPAEWCLALEFCSNSLRTPEGTNGHAFHRKPCIHLSCSRTHNTHPHPPMAFKQSAGEAWTIARSGQQPHAWLVNRRVVHQDVRRRQKQP